MDEIKKEFRRELRQRIAALDEKYLEKSNKKIYDTMSALEEIKNARDIFAYYSAKKEVDTHELIRLWLKEGKRVYLPISYKGGVMSFHRLTDPGQLTEGMYDLLQPSEQAEEGEPDESSVIIVPALTYDVRGYRMGQGGGYYDRWLKKHGGFSVGLARDALICPQVPVMPHDCRVDCVVTESGARYFDRDKAESGRSPEKSPAS